MGDSPLRCTLSLARHSISGDGERFRSVERIFHVKENQTTVRRELLAGLTTFMTMAYVVIVNPQILAESPSTECCSPLAFPPRWQRWLWTLGELPDCPRSWNVVERLLHLFHCSWPRRAMEDSARSSISLWSLAYAEQHSRAGRQRHTGLPQARNSRRHRLVYRVYRLAQRKDDHG